MNRSRIDRRDFLQSQPAYLGQLRQAIAAFLPARGLPLMAAKRWSDRLLVMVMLLLVWSAQGTQVDRFAEARAAVVGMYPSRKRPGASLAGFLAAMVRHSRRLLALLRAALCRHMQEDLCAVWRVGRFLAFGFDGTRIDCPRTCANEHYFKIGGRRKSGPQMVLGTLIHLGSGLIWAWRRGDACTSERTLLRDLLQDLPQGTLLLTDAGLPGYDLLAEILGAGHDILMRVGANVRLLQKLGCHVKEHAGIVYLWTDRAQARGLPPLILRQIVLSDGRNRRMCLLTNLLTDDLLTAAEARALYQRRWGVELLYRAMKQTLARRKMLSDSPAHAQMELDWSVMGLWMLGLILWRHRAEPTPVTRGMAQALRLVRGAMAGRVDQRCLLVRRLGQIRCDTYRRRSDKNARQWPHKKNEPPCGLPQLRTATRAEIRLAKAFFEQKRAA
jgi:hypothetical protein